MPFYVACFDITDDRTRYRVGKALAEYGTRVQRSVFEIAVANNHQLNTLRRDIADLLDDDDDCRFYAICKACRQRSHDSSGERIAQLPAAVLI